MDFLALSGLINGSVASALGFFFYSRSPHSAKHRAYGLYCLSLAMWGFFFFAWQLAETPETALLFARLLMAGAILIPITHLYHVVTILNQETAHRRWLWIGGFLTGIFLIFDFTPAFIESVGPQLWFPFWPKPGIVFHVFLCWFIGLFLYTSFLFFQAYRHASGVNRNTYLYLLIGSIIGYGGGGSNFFLWYGIPVVPHGTILVSLYILIVAYTFVKYRLLDFSVALEKGLTYLLLVAILGIPAFTLVLYAEKYVWGHISYPFSTLIFMMFVVTVAVVYATRRTKPLLVKRFFKNRRPDRYETLERFSQALVTILDLQALSQKIVQTIAEIMEIKHVTLCIEAGQANRFLPVASLSSQGPPVSQPLSLDPKFLRYLISKQSAVVKVELDHMPVHHRPAAVVTALKTLEAAVCLPFVNKNQLIGFCCLGPRPFHKTYSQEDVQFLTTLAHEAAIALDNARIYEAVKHSQTMVQRTGQLRALETLAGGLAHEIRNPLTSIKTFLQLLPVKSHDQQFLTQFGPIAKEDVTRIERLTREILEYARPSEPDFQAEDMNALLESCLQGVIFSRFGKTVTVEKHLDPHLPFIRGDRQRLKQVFLNVLINGIEAMEGTEKILRVETHEMFNRSQESWVQISIADSGIGIPTTDLEHIFDPFFTTKHLSRENEGTGLGLAIAHHIVHEHGGYIEVVSALGGGTSFLICLPSINTAIPTVP